MLPTTIAAAILLIGAILSVFLAWDGGPRQGAIRLPIEKPSDEERGVVRPDSSAAPHIDLSETPLREERTPSFGALILRKKISGYFARRVREAYGQNTPDVSSPASPRVGSFAEIGPSAVRNRLPSRSTRFSGSAYGYRPRHGSQATITSALRRESAVSHDIRQRRGSTRPLEDSAGVQEELSLAQRLLIGKSFKQYGPPFAS